MPKTDLPPLLLRRPQAPAAPLLCDRSGAGIRELERRGHPVTEGRCPRPRPQTTCRQARARAHSCRPASACATSGAGAPSPVCRGRQGRRGRKPSPGLAFGHAFACSRLPSQRGFSPSPAQRAQTASARPPFKSGLRKHGKDWG